MITIVDYGIGNIQAFINIYKKLNIPVKTASTKGELVGASRLILPGVGAFDWAMTRLNDSGLLPVLNELVIKNKLPVLGVCVGMQMMAKRSDEGVLPGLGWIDAKVVRFSQDVVGELPLPHMGWNDVEPMKHDCIFKNIETPRYYFLHSYLMVPANSSDILATSQYGHEFTSAINHNNVFGTQFHPEKSHQWGVDLLRNFAEI